MEDINVNPKVGDCMSAIKGLKPVAVMILVQIVLAGLNIVYKLALNDGMDAKILVAYRYVFAAAVLSPGIVPGGACTHAYLEEKTDLDMEGIVASLLLWTVSAKVAGTFAGLVGAMILAIYKGPAVNLWSTNIDLLKHGNHQAMARHGSGDQIAGSLLAIASCLSFSIAMVLQAKMTNIYPCPYSCAVLMCLIGSIQATVYALCLNQDVTQLGLCFDIRLLAVSYSGVGAALNFSVLCWCIQQRGPFFASIFKPLVLVIVVLLGSLQLNEKLHLGSIIGTFLIVIGLYMVLWGKGREAMARVGELSSKSAKEPPETISGSGSLDRHASFAQNASHSDGGTEKLEIDLEEKPLSPEV